LLKSLLALFLGASAGICAQAQLSTAATTNPNITNAYASKHVFLVMLENRSDADALKYMPYLTGLANQYSRAAKVYSATHGSFLAYGELTTGFAPKNSSALGGICGEPGCSQTINVPNLVRQFAANGLTWKGYFQSIPSVGYMGTQSGHYVKRHNPFPWLSDVVNSSTQQKKMVSDTQLATDLQLGSVANYNLIVPDLTHDGHDPSTTSTALSNADNYLAGYLPTLLASKYFQPGGDGVLFVTFDESELSGDNTCGTSPETNKCGGHIFFAAIGPNVKRGFLSSTHHPQADILRTTCDLLGVSACPGDGATAHGMSELFTTTTTTCSAPGSAGVNVCSPTASAYTGAVNVTAAGTGPNGTTTRIELWLDGTKAGQWTGNTISTTISPATGSHRVVVSAVDNTGATVKSTAFNFTEN
jgi:phosphatidylinositol-3-phosphatase